MANLKYIGKNILNHDLEVKKGNVSGSSSSTGSFGRVESTTIGGTLTTAAQTNITSLGTLTGLTVSDDVTLSGTTPKLRIIDTDATDTIEMFEIENSSTTTNYNTRNSSGGFVSTDHQIGRGSSGASSFVWNIGGTRTFELAANTISGSSTSTGSFGQVKVGSSTIKSSIISSGGGFDLGLVGSSASKLRFDGDSMMIRGDGSGNMTFTLNNDFIIKKESGHVRLTVDEYKVSGSSTSTGSFGHGYIDSKLGIGTLSPSKHIHISGSGERNMFIQSTDGLARFQMEGATQSDIIMTDTGGGSNAKKIQLTILDDLFKIRTLTDAGDIGNEMMNFDLANNRIGIGTTSPTEALTVTGDISASGDFHLDGQAGFGSAPNTNYAATFQQPTGTNKDYIQGVQDNGSNQAFKIDTDSGDNVSLRLYNGSGAQKIHLEGKEGGTSTFEGNISASSAYTGSFGRVEATTIGGTLTTAAQTNITSVGTIGTGTWQGTAIASAYLDADTAHLTTDQTFTGNKTFSGHITGSGNVKFGTTGTSISRYEFNKTAGGTTPFHYIGRDTSNASYPIATFNHNGGTSLWVGTTKVSGSSTSTGSFGRVESNTFNATTFTSTEVTSTNLTVTGTITGSSLDVSGNGNFGGNVIVEGDITAQNYIVSSSVTNITTQELSGSTVFGDTSDDTHQFTGSLNVTGSQIHLQRSALSGFDEYDDDLLVIERSGDYSNLNLVSDVGSYLLFSDATRAVGTLGYVHSGDYLTIGVAGVADHVKVTSTKTTFTQTSGIELINTGNNTVFHIPASSAYQIGTQGSKPMVFYTNNTEAGRFDTSQNFLMGLTSAVTDDIGHVTPKIQVEGTDKNSAISIIRNSNDVNPSYLMLGKTRGTSVGSDTIVQDGDVLGAVRFIGADGVDRKSYGAEITAEVDGTPGSDDMPGRLIFETTSDGSQTSTERMRIDSSGNVIFQSDNVKISGSSTSTGSFGHLHVAAVPGTYLATLGNDGLSVKGSSNSTGTNFRVRDGSGNTRFNVHGYGQTGIGTDSAQTMLHIVQTSSGLQNSIGEYIRLQDSSNYSASFGLGSNGTLKLIGGTVNVASEGSGAGNLTVDGKVHIGAATTPTNHLEVEGTIYASGNISGSSTSTGSFGAGYIDNKLGIGISAPTHKLHVLSTDNKAFLLDRNTGNNPTSLNEFSSYYSLSIKNRASGTYLNFGGDSTHTSLQATDGAGSATAKNIVLNPYGGNIGIAMAGTAPTEKLHVVGNIFATGNISGSSDSTGSFGKLESTTATFEDKSLDNYHIDIYHGDASGSKIESQRELWITSNAEMNFITDANGNAGSERLWRFASSDSSTTWEPARTYFKISAAENSQHAFAELFNNDNGSKVKLNSSGDSYFMGGDIGIGTTSPDTILHLKTTSGGSNGITIENSGGDDAYVNLKTDSRSWYLGVDGNSTFSTDAFQIYDNNASKNRLLINTSGDVIFPDGVSKISGSSTSTGSFGSLYVDNRIGLGITNPQAYDTAVKNPVVIGAGASGGNNAGISVISSTGGYGTLYFGDGTGAAVYRGAVEYNHSDDSLKIWTAGTAGSGIAITIDSSNNTKFAGNIISTKANGLISGSSTSTGSFGRGVIADTLRVNSTDTSATPLFIKSAGTDTAVFNIDASDGIDLFRVDEDSSGNSKVVMRDTSGNADIQLHTGTHTYFNNNGNFGIGTTSPGTKLDIQGTSSSGTIIQIRDTDDDHPVGVTYNHGTSGHHYSWYAGTMDGTSGERKFTIGTEVRDGYDIALTQTAASLFMLSQFDKSATFAGNVSSSATSTGSFGRVEVNSISASNYVGQIGSRYVHSQTSDSATWTINHNIGSQYPVVTVYDSSDQMILPQNGVATDSDTFTLTFNEAIQGKAVVSVGGIGTNAGGNYIHVQSDSSTNWNVTHSLSQQYPNITVFDENDEVILPETITALDDNHSTITFSGGKTGYANFSIGSGIPNITHANAGKVLKVRSDGTGVEWSPTSNDVSGSMSVSGSILPTIDNFHDLGSDTQRWANLYTGDIQLSNEGSGGNEVDGTTGSWTIQEGEDDLYLLNRKNGKKYKFKLEEIT